MNLVLQYVVLAEAPDPALSSVSSTSARDQNMRLELGYFDLLGSETRRMAPEETNTILDLDSTNFSLKRWTR